MGPDATILHILRNNESDEIEDVATWIDDQLNSILFYAIIFRSSVEVVKAIIKLHVYPTIRENKFKILHMAVQTNAKEEIVEALLAAGGNPNEKESEDNEYIIRHKSKPDEIIQIYKKATPLQYACLH